MGGSYIMVTQMLGCEYEFGLQQDGNPQQSGSLYSKPTKEIVQKLVEDY